MALSHHTKAKNNEQMFHKILPVPAKNCFFKKDSSYFILSHDSHAMNGLLNGIYCCITHMTQRRQNKNRESDLDTLRCLQTSHD